MADQVAGDTAPLARAERHPERRLLESFGRGRLSAADDRAIVRHLLLGCPKCVRITARLLPVAGLALDGAEADLAGAVTASPLKVADLMDRGALFDYTAAFAAVRRELARRQAALTAEQAAAPDLLHELARHSFDRQWILVTSTPRFHTWSFCDLLLEASREWGFQDPGRALELAELGATVAAHLSRATYGSARVNDLSARAWATLANAERIRSDFRSAEKGFLRAERLLKSGTGDPLEKARVLLLKASLRGNQQRFEEAFRLLDRVVAIGRHCGDLHLCGKALITKGFICGIAERPADAIRALEEGSELVDSEAEPRLLVAARHNLILYLNELGRQGEALALLERTRPLYAELGDRMNLVRLRWLEGKIALAASRLAEAEPLLVQVGAELAQLDLSYDAALVSLDLALVYVRQGRHAEVRRLAEEMIPIFQSRDVHREAIAALIVFQKAAEMERVTLGLVRELSEFLRKCRETPGLRFRDPL
jgi:tetratricopeptide (TPR) repeat protein